MMQGWIQRLLAATCWLGLWVTVAGAQAQPDGLSRAERWQRLERLAREGHHGAVVELAAGDGELTPALQPTDARQALLLGVSGLRAAAGPALESLAAGRPLGELETRLRTAAAQLEQGLALLGSGTDHSLPDDRIAWLRQNLEAHKLLADHLLAEHRLRAEAQTGVTAEQVHQHLEDWLEADASKGAIHSFVDKARLKSEALQTPRKAIGKEAERIARTSVGLDDLRRTFDRAAWHLQETMGDPDKSQIGKNEELDSAITELGRRLAADDLALCSPARDTPPEANGDLYQLFRYLCPMKDELRAHRQTAEALAAFIGQHPPETKRRQAALALVELLLNDAYRRDSTAPELRAMKQRLEQETTGHDLPGAER